MNYPKLVKQDKCKTDIRVVLYSENISEDGEPEIIFDKNLKCNWQDSAKQVLNDKKQIVLLTGTALFCGDIAPDIVVISAGFIEVFGEKRNIYKGAKCRNPDNTVNYTRLDLE